MRKKRTILWIGIVFLLLIGAAWAWRLYDKPHQSAASESADVTINADTLYHQYQADEHAADQKYMGKVISVTGRLVEIQHNGNSIIWILSTQPGGGGINCQLFAGTKVDPEPKAGDTVTLKGRCTGFLMDVNLADCVPDK
jgi:RecJ-like exonuclease